MTDKYSRLWLIGKIIGSMAMLLLLLGLCLPLLVNLKPIKEKILDSLSQKTGGQITINNIGLNLLPTPHISLKHIRFSTGESFAGTIDSVDAYPEIFPLMAGDFRIIRLRLITPEFQLKSPNGSQSLPQETDQQQVGSIGADLIQKLKAIAAKSPGLSIRIEKGRLEYFASRKISFKLLQLDGRLDLPPDKFKLDVTCRSNLWQNLSLRTQIDNQFNIDGTIRVSDFQPKLMYDYFFPSAKLKLSEAQFSLAAKFSSEAFKNLQLDLQGSLAKISLNKLGETISIQGKTFKLTAQSNKDQTAVNIAELVLDAPHLNLSGSFTKRGQPSQFELSLEGRDVDVDATRHAALALLGDSSDIQKIFEILVGGTVPVITFATHGSELKDLGKAENIHITGTMTKGKIYVPKAELDLTEVYGDVVISHGILVGKDLRAQLDNSQGSEGYLRVGLVGKDPPFHLDIQILANLIQLPPILLRVVKNKNFTGEIKRITSFEGNARGRMVLGESLDSIKALVQVADIRLNSVYERIPYPLLINNGEFFYDGTKEIISVRDLKGTLGGSSFSAFSGELDWSKEMKLKVLSKNANLLVKEIYPWIISYPILEKKLKEFKFDGGSVAIEALSLAGPLLHPEKWDFELSGTIQNLTVDWVSFPGSLSIASGSFKGLPQKLMLIDAQSKMLDASLTTSATLYQFLEGFSGADLDVSGSLGQKAIKWIAGLSKIPSQLDFRPPLAISNGHLSWERNSETSFSGQLLPTGGPKVTVDQTWQKNRLLIKKMLIQDSESLANISLDLKPEAFDLTFSGNLTKGTADKLLQNNQILAGWLKGNFSAHVQLEKYFESTSSGELQGEGLMLPITERIYAVKSFSVSAQENLLNVESATVYWQDKELELSGKVNFSSAGLLVDMNASIDGILWEDIDHFLTASKKNAEQSKHIGNLGFLGILRLDAGFLGYEKLTWRPFHADIHFEPKGIEVLVTRAELCGLQTPGTINRSSGNINLDFKPKAENQRLDLTLSCLWDNQGLMEGSYSFNANIMGGSGAPSFIESLHGPLFFKAENGRIFRFGLIESLFSVLNFTEIFRGKLPDLKQEGFGYEFVEIHGDLKDGKLEIEEAVIKGNSIEMVGRGSVDLATKKIDLSVLVAPLKTLDVIIGYIPLINGILGSIVSIPVQVTGDLSNPIVIPLSPSAVGTELLGVMKKTLQLPLKIIQPLISSTDEKPDKDTNQQEPLQSKEQN